MNTDPPRPAGADVSSPASGVDGLDPRAAMLLLVCTCTAIVSSPADARLLLFPTGIVYVAVRGSNALLLLRRILLLLPMSIGFGVYMYFAGGGSMGNGAIPGLSQDALVSSAVAVLRMLLVAAASLLFGLSVPMQQLAAALRALHIPDSVVSVLWMTERLFHLLVSDARRMLETVRARSVDLSVRLRIRTVTRMSSAFLVRAVSRSDRMADALLARGFDGRIPLLLSLHWRITDTLACCFAAALLGLTLLPL